MSSNNNLRSSADQLAEYRKRQSSIRGATSTNQQPSTAMIPERSSAFEEHHQQLQQPQPEEAGDKEVIDLDDDVEQPREKTEYERMIEAQMQMYPDGFEDDAELGNE